MGVEAALVVLALLVLGGRRRHGPARTELPKSSSTPAKARTFPRPSGPPAPVATQLPPGDGYVLKNPAKAWGTADAIASLRAALARWNLCRAEYGLPFELRVADISAMGGGALPPHLSHHEGRDVDVSVQGHGLPLEALPCLLLAFMSDENVKSIYLDHGLQGQLHELLVAEPHLGVELLPELQYPMAPGAGMTRIRHWKGHRNHIHVRFAR